MFYRTEIDNDITLYSYAELETMIRILENKNRRSYVPFSHNEIKAELLRRQGELS